MKQRLAKLIHQAVESAYENGELNPSDIPEVEIEEPKAEAHGDFSTNTAMKMAAAQKLPPRKLAEIIINHINDPEKLIARTEIAGPGFINFHIQPSAWYPLLKQIHEAGLKFGASDVGQGKKIQIEFVSSNPTGPLHVGHGRGAAVGDSTANILEYCGYDVQREYYINDSGRQIQTLGRSVFLRYREMGGEEIDFPGDCYQGEYIRDLADEIREKEGERLMDTDEAEAIEHCARHASSKIIDGIRADLNQFGVTFDRWFSEQSLYDSGMVDKDIKALQDQGVIYEKDQALWFRTTDFGDEKDRVVVRKNGVTTYFASDITYHKDKYDRGFEKVIDVWGADHHGYIPRMTAAIEAFGKKRDRFHVILVQLVNLLRGGEPVAMSTRAGEFVTLGDVIQEVGSDAARFIFLTRHYESPLDFDLELAKKQTNDNPVYYVQYVHARISSIIRKAGERGIDNITWDDGAIQMLREPEEIRLIKTMARYPEVIKSSAEYMEPHRVTFFLRSLASEFHSYYNKHRVLVDDQTLCRGRLYLVSALKKLIHNGLTLLGVSAPERM